MAVRLTTCRLCTCLSDHGHNGGTSACSSLCSLVSNGRHLSRHMCSTLCLVTTALRENCRCRGVSGTAFLRWGVVQCRDHGSPLVTPRDTDPVLIALLFIYDSVFHGSVVDAVAPWGLTLCRVT